MSDTILFRLLRKLHTFYRAASYSSPSATVLSHGQAFLNTSRAITSGLWCSMTTKQEAARKMLSGRLRTFSRISHHNSLVAGACRRYSTYEKTSTQLLSKLFPQTAVDADDEESRERRRREEEEDAQEIERAWFRMKLGLGFFGFGSIFISAWALYFFGRPSLDKDGNEVTDEYSDLPMAKQYAFRTWRTLNTFQRFIQEPSSRKLLPDPLSPPYIQPSYTLVLELKDVLIHPDWTYETGWRFKKRPGVDLFLRECAKYFEVVVYTAEQGITVFPLLDALDPSGYIMYRLVRDSTHFVDGHHVKNLDNLNRDLKRVIVVDWDTNSTKMHPHNCFVIQRWTGNDDDTTLYDLISFLSVVGNSDVDDIREVLNYYKQFSDPLMQFRENQKKLVEQMQQRELEMKAKSTPIVKNFSRGFGSSMGSPAHRPPSC